MNGLVLNGGAAALAIQSTAPDLLTRLEKPFQAFLLPPNTPPQAVLTIECGSGAPLPFIQPAIHRAGDRLRFEAPAYHGWLALESGQAGLSMTGMQPAAADFMLRVLCAVLACQQDGLLLHAAGLLHRGRARAFYGHSGSGKTTLARLSTGQIILNDDLIWLTPAAGGWTAHATPFWNPSQNRPQPGSAPLDGLFALVKDREHRLDPLPASRAAAGLMSALPLAAALPAWSSRLLAQVSCLCAQTRAFALHFTKEDGAFWDLIDGALP